MSYETDYKALVQKILRTGEVREGRNGITKSIFGETLTVDLQEGFPILQGRKIFYKGVFGELAAMLRQPKNVKDFEEYGCNYWKLWQDNDNGDITVDYGNKWLDFNGFNQLEDVLNKIKTNPHDRRMIVTGWDPSNLDNLSLPCCHYAYQWYVRDDAYLDMLWHQRSVDTMVGLPSDVVFAAAWLIAMSMETGLQPGRITFTLGDTHVYEEHWNQACSYSKDRHTNTKVEWEWHQRHNRPTVAFVPNDLRLIAYNPASTIKFKLKA